MNNKITLRQGLDQFHETYKDRLSHNNEEISAPAKSFFMSHDVAHVVFGCDISLYGEGSVKIWTIFGTSLGFWRHISGYQEANAFTLTKDYNLRHILNNIFRFILVIPKLIMRARKMNKLWPWNEYQSYLDTPLSEIRKEFNIQILP